jgi:hypothetical protein
MDEDNELKELKPTDVPNEIWTSILDLLPIRDVNTFRQCNRHFRDTPLNRVEYRWFNIMNGEFDPLDVSDRVLDQVRGGDNLWDVLMILRRVNPILRQETDPVDERGQRVATELLKIFWREPFYTEINSTLPLLTHEQYLEVAIIALDTANRPEDWNQFVHIVTQHNLQRDIAIHVSRNEYSFEITNYLFDVVFNINQNDAQQLAQNSIQSNLYFLVNLSHLFPDVVRNLIGNREQFYEERIITRNDYRDIRDYYQDFYTFLFGEYPYTDLDYEIDEEEQESEDEWLEAERADSYLAGW